MSERQQYSEEVRASVLAALLAGQSINQVARDYNIPKGTVSYWKNNQGRETQTQKKEEIGELLIQYLRANLSALKEQTKMFSNQEWLAKQNAADIAVLHGVMTDKAIRLLEAMSKDQERSGNDRD